MQQHDNQWFEKQLPLSKTTEKLDKRNSLELNKEKYRTRLLGVLKENDDLKRSEIKKKCVTAYAWLKNNDNAWFEKQLPPSQSIKKFDWNEVDRKLAQRVKTVSIQLIKSNPNTRVARYSIMEAWTKRKSGRIKTYIKHLPQTEQALNECAETKEQYQIRHSSALVRQLRTHFNYGEVTLETIMSYRRSYRGISDEMKEILRAKLTDMNNEFFPIAD